MKTSQGVHIARPESGYDGPREQATLTLSGYAFGRYHARLP